MDSDTGAPRLNRRRPGAPAAPPVRLLHLGVGNFHRAHQAWYTAHAPDHDQWGYAAFTGRRAEVADALAPQDGLYTLVTRSDDGDAFELVGSIADVRPATDHARLLSYFRRPELAVVTITVTEAGYRRRPDGRLDLDDDAVAADLAALRDEPEAGVATMPARLVAGLLARRDAGVGPLTVLSCDNLPENGTVTATVVGDLAGRLDPSLRDWIDQQVDFATSMVDRITPATTEDDLALVASSQGYADAAPVPTEPFSEWVISGAFPAGRPAWDRAGAMIVDDVTPYEQRKLWLLNGSHSLLAYAASIRGHATIAEAITDPECRGWVETWWDEAARHLSLPAADVKAYRAALLVRFANRRVRHQLAQIAADGSTKMVIRIVPTVLAERADDRLPVGAATAIAGWLLHLRGLGVPIKDPGAGSAVEAATSSDELIPAATALLGLLHDSLGSDDAFVRLVADRADELGGPG